MYFHRVILVKGRDKHRFGGDSCKIKTEDDAADAHRSRLVLRAGL